MGFWRLPHRFPSFLSLSSFQSLGFPCVVVVVQCGIGVDGVHSLRFFHDGDEFRRGFGVRLDDGPGGSVGATCSGCERYVNRLTLLSSFPLLLCVFVLVVVSSFIEAVAVLVLRSSFQCG